MTENEILENAYQYAKSTSKSINSIIFEHHISDSIDVMIQKIDSNKSLLSALVTSILKKQISPEQDIRLHRTDFEKGYSARSLDTHITAPFFKKYFIKYANKESAFLTLATREKIAWNKSEGNNLKIRDKKVKEAFLEVIDFIQNSPQNASFQALIYLFAQLIILSEKQQKIFDEVLNTSINQSVLNINLVIKLLKIHFETRLSSRLPVIAIYSAYKGFINKINDYKGKKLLPLNVHTSSDKHGFGDIEIINEDNTSDEIIEVKHNVPINRNHIIDIAKKCENSSVKRYYILTTYKGSFEEGEEEIIEKLVASIQHKTGLEIVVNGVLDSIKYYLRFIKDYKQFLSDYAEALVLDAKNSTEVKNFHIEEWDKILVEHNLK